MAGENSSHAPGTRAANQEVQQRLFVIAVDRDPMVIDSRLDNGLPQALEITAKCGVIAVGDVARVGEDGGAPFHIEKAHRPMECEFQLERVEQMERRQIVFAKTKMLERAL